MDWGLVGLVQPSLRSEGLTQFLFSAFILFMTSTLLFCCFLCLRFFFFICACMLWVFDKIVGVKKRVGTTTIYVLDENVKDGRNTWDEGSSSIVHTLQRTNQKLWHTTRKMSKKYSACEELLTWYFGNQGNWCWWKEEKGRLPHTYSHTDTHELQLPIMKAGQIEMNYIWVGMSRGMFCSCIKYLTNGNLCVCQLLQAHMWGSICFSNKKFPRIQ